jgi:hypothetical protein
VLLVEVILPRLTEGFPMNIQHPTSMTPLRARMIADMSGRNLGPASQSSHLRACKRFAAWLGRSPETATPDDVKYFQQHLIESGVSICTRNQTMDSRHDLPSIQPSSPNTNTALTRYYSPKSYVGFAMAAPPSLSALALGRLVPNVLDAAFCANVGFFRMISKVQELQNGIPITGHFQRLHALAQRSARTIAPTIHSPRAQLGSS